VGFEEGEARFEGRLQVGEEGFGSSHCDEAKISHTSRLGM
jgi:hypothetical protein